MRVVVPRETEEGETRVALVPELVGRLVALGHEVVVQPGAGLAAQIADEEYVAAGAGLETDPFAGAGAVLSVRPLALDVVRRLPRGALTVSFLPTGSDPACLPLIEALRDGAVTSLAMELVPRISRAQSMDALTSQALVSGYRGAVVAVEMLRRFFPLAMTAAGTIEPAQVLVLGTGVAGLQAIATTRRLGAVVRGYDVRTSSAEEIASLGAEPIDLGLEPLTGAAGYAREMSAERAGRQRELLAPYVAAADVLITTAAVPGLRAPMLVSAEMVAAMRPGSVVVDLAAETGGNVAGAVPGEVVAIGGVQVWGGADVPCQLPGPASRLYAHNVVSLLELLTSAGELHLDLDDEIVAAACVVHHRRIRHEATRLAVEGSRTGGGGTVGPSSDVPATESARIASGSGSGSGSGRAFPRSPRPRQESGPDAVATLLAEAGRVVVVPGYGLAAARAQHALRALADALEARGSRVVYVVHPVAGRLPGHLNALLDEAGVPHAQLVGLEEIDADLRHTDVVLVVGAADIVNPAARTTPSSPLHGMAVLDVAGAGQVVVLKRSYDGRGYAGVANALVDEPRTTMLLGDARTSLEALLAAVVGLGAP